MRAGGSLVFGRGTSRTSFEDTCCSNSTTLAPHETPSLGRDLPSPDVPSRGPARRGRVSVRRLARGGRAVVVAGAAARAAGRGRIPVPRDLGVRGLAQAPRG